MPASTQEMAARPATAADQPLLFALFCAGQQERFASLRLAAQQLRPLLALQFGARQADYAQRFPDATDRILTLVDGTPVGRHLVERRADHYRGLDLAVLPEYQNRGIGSWALQQVQQLATLERVSFRLRVLRSNRALRLYQRAGFVCAVVDDVSYEMNWVSPAGDGCPDRPVAVVTAASLPGQTSSVAGLLHSPCSEPGWAFRVPQEQCHAG